jgi:hypothetical protein
LKSCQENPLKKAVLYGIIALWAAVHRVAANPYHYPYEYP